MKIKEKKTYEWQDFIKENLSENQLIEYQKEQEDSRSYSEVELKRRTIELCVLSGCDVYEYASRMHGFSTAKLKAKHCVYNYHYCLTLPK